MDTEGEKDRYQFSKGGSGERRRDSNTREGKMGGRSSRKKRRKVTLFW